MRLISDLGLLTAKGMCKFKKHVEQISFNGRHALKFGQAVLYVTEAAVFQMKDSGVELTEYVDRIGY